jgi:hypothetical protein
LDSPPTAERAARGTRSGEAQSVDLQNERIAKMFHVKHCRHKFAGKSFIVDKPRDGMGDAQCANRNLAIGNVFLN